MPGAEAIPDAEINKIINTSEVIDRDTYPETITHLRHAAMQGNVADVANLLRRGADPNIAGIFCGTTALHDAIRIYSAGTPEIVRLLLEHGAALDPIDRSNDCTALDFAVRGFHTEAVKLLLAKGAPATFRKVHMSLQAKYPEADAVIKLLLDHGAAVNEPGVWNRTILMWAALGASLETVELLLKAGADVNYVAVFNNLPETALNLAQKAKRTDVVAALKNAGAKK
jgi:hypothetical protein